MSLRAFSFSSLESYLAKFIANWSKQAYPIVTSMKLFRMYGAMLGRLEISYAPARSWASAIVRASKIIPVASSQLSSPLTAHGPFVVSTPP